MSLRSSAAPGSLARVFRNVGWLLAGKGAGAVLSLIYLGIATRTLHPLGFGRFSLVLGVGQALVALVSFQTWQVVIRFGAAHLEAGRPAALARLMRWCLLLDAGAALAGCGLAAVAVLLLSSMLGLPRELRWPALLFCWIMLLSIRSTAVGLLRLHDRFGAGALADASTSVLRLVGTLAALALRPTVSGFLAAWAMAEIGTAFSYWWLVARVAPAALGSTEGVSLRKVPGENPGLRAFAGITNASATLAAVGKQLPVLLVGAVVGPVAAGAYRLAYQLAQALARASDMFARAAFAELARVHAAGAGAGLRRLFRQTFLLAAASGSLIALVLVTAGHRLLRLIAGPGYDAAFPLLLLLGLAASIDIVGTGFEPLLMAAGGQGRAFRIRLTVTALLLLALAIGTGAMGATGAAIAMLASSALGFLLLGLASRRLLAETA